MQQRLRALLASILGVLVCTQLATSGTAHAQDGAPFCAPGQPARFVQGIADLRERLGDPMGAPVECEHVDPDSKDTIQHTTTGLAYYRPSINTAMFTDGETHWALANDQLLLWRNASVTPPQPTPIEAAYLDQTAPLRNRYATLTNRLTAIRRQADAGQLDAVDVQVLTTLVDDLRATRDAYAAVRQSGRLYRHYGLMVTSVNSAMAAAEMLAQARQIQAPEIRREFLNDAAGYRQESERLRNAAADAYVRTLPIVVG
ncbi:MAG: hypothetical protein AB7K36_21370 [Chloroflexota bacterium]